MGILATDEFKLHKRLDTVYELCYYINDGGSAMMVDRGPGVQVVQMMNAREFPIDDFPSKNKVLQMVADELAIQYGATVERRFETVYNSKISWRPIGRPFIDSWVYGTFPVLIFFRS